MSNWKQIIADAKELLDIGAITQEEFDAAKQEAFAFRSQSNTTPPSPPPNLADMGTRIYTGGVTPTTPSGLDDMGTMVGKMGGDVVGSHKIIELLGKGGMGSVYRGRHTLEVFAEAEGDVAIKMILPSLAKDEAFRNRFIREASLGKKLNHPNIAKVVSIHSGDDVLALVMEYIEGKELKDLIPKGGMSVDDVVQLLKPIASALDYLHEKGIVHRDMKPANVRVKPDGTPVILDFGIAKDTNEVDSNMTQTGTAMGTQTYMAPEQMDAKRVTGAADQYALAMMAYQMLSGKLPWDEGLSSVRVTMAKMTGDFKTLEDVSSSVSVVVMRGLNLNPEERYSTCIEFVVEIDNAPSDEQLALEEIKLAEEQQRIEQERLAEEARLAEETRLEAERLEKERLAEEIRLVGEARLLEEARLAEQERLAEEARLAKEAEQARQQAEQQRKRQEIQEQMARQRDQILTEKESKSTDKLEDETVSEFKEVRRIKEQENVVESSVTSENKEVAGMAIFDNKSSSGALENLDSKLVLQTDSISSYNETESTGRSDFIKWLSVACVLLFCGIIFAINYAAEQNNLQARLRDLESRNFADLSVPTDTLSEGMLDDFEHEIEQQEKMLSLVNENEQDAKFFEVSLPVIHTDESNTLGFDAQEVQDYIEKVKVLRDNYDRLIKFTNEGLIPKSLFSSLPTEIGGTHSNKYSKGEVDKIERDLKKWRTKTSYQHYLDSLNKSKRTIMIELLDENEHGGHVCGDHWNDYTELCYFYFNNEKERVEVKSEGPSSIYKGWIEPLNDRQFILHGEVHQIKAPWKNDEDFPDSCRGKRAYKFQRTGTRQYWRHYKDCKVAFYYDIIRKKVD